MWCARFDLGTETVSSCPFLSIRFVGSRSPSKEEPQVVSTWPKMRTPLGSELDRKSGAMCTAIGHSTTQIYLCGLLQNSFLDTVQSSPYICVIESNKHHTKIVPYLAVQSTYRLVNLFLCRGAEKVCLLSLPRSLCSSFLIVV